LILLILINMSPLSINCILLMRLYTLYIPFFIKFKSGDFSNLLLSNIKITQSSLLPIDFESIEKARIKIKNLFKLLSRNKKLIKYLSNYSIYLHGPKSYMNKYYKNLDSDIFSIVNSLEKFDMKIEGSIKNYRKRAGIYIIRHKEFNSFYIGSSLSIYDRIKEHLFVYGIKHRGGDNQFYRFVKKTGG